jgi:hypothetical protein
LDIKDELSILDSLESPLILEAAEDVLNELVGEVLVLGHSQALSAVERIDNVKGARGLLAAVADDPVAASANDLALLHPKCQFLSSHY